MKAIDSQHILVSTNKNAHVIRNVATESPEIIAELNLKNREMSSSLVFKSTLLIGTFVDTLFVFSLEDYAPLF